MSELLLKHIKNHAPKFNPDVANGLARDHLEYRRVLKYVDDVCKHVLVGIEGFKYLGITPITPLEEFQELTKTRNSERSYDMARSDTYMVRLNFEFKGVPLSKLMSLPFVGFAGTMYLRGTRYVITPVITDRVISITPPDIFVRLLRDRIIFKRLTYFFKANAGAELNGHYETIRETNPVVYATIYKQKKTKANRIFNMETNMVFYMLCKYGCSEMFRLFANTKVEYVDINSDLSHIDFSKYVLCQTTGIKPRSLRRAYYQTSNVGLLFKREDYNTTVKNLVAGVFYILDHFSEEILPEDLDSTTKWRVAMGNVIWGQNVNAGKLYTDLSDHIVSLDNYFDEIVKKNFRDIGYPIEDIYQLFHLVSEKFTEWQLNHVNNEANLYEKEISVLYYVLLKISEQIVNFYFKLVKDSKKGLTINDVTNALNSKLRSQAILQLYKGTAMINPAMSPGDNIVPRFSQMIIPQTQTNKNAKSRKISHTDEAARLHVSVCEVATQNTMSKADPTGHTRINMYLKVCPDTNKVIRDERFRELLDGIQEKLNEFRR